jgi:hypothetical protein
MMVDEVFPLVSLLPDDEAEGVRPTTIAGGGLVRRCFGSTATGWRLFQRLTGID